MYLEQKIAQLKTNFIFYVVQTPDFEACMAWKHAQKEVNLN